MLRSDFLSTFKRYTTDERRHAVAKLELVIETIKDGSREDKRLIGVYDIQRPMPEWVKHKYPDWQERSVLDSCYWQLVRFYRVRHILLFA